MVTLEKHGQKWSFDLNFVTTEYNCGAKIVGRLSPKIVYLATQKEVYFSEITDVIEANKDTIIADLAKKLDDRKTFKPLNSSSPSFPSDSGVYLPTCVLYGDRIVAPQGTLWYNNWRGLIKELRNNPKLGWKVIDGPVYINRLYGGNCWSKWWFIFPPSQAAAVVEKTSLHLDRFGSNDRSLTSIRDTVESHDYTFLEQVYGKVS
jgi:hypothetical protein